jgi:hypothetical protein
MFLSSHKKEMIFISPYAYEHAKKLSNDTTKHGEKQKPFSLSVYGNKKQYQAPVY